MKEQERNELVNYRLNRARETIQEVEILIDNQLWSTAVNRIYYACFYAVSALLLHHQINAQTHSGIRRMFGLKFIKTGLIDKELGKFYTDIFDKRITGDYDDFVEFDANEVKSFVKPASLLIRKLEQIIENNSSF